MLCSVCSFVQCYVVLCCLSCEVFSNVVQCCLLLCNCVVCCAILCSVLQCFAIFRNVVQFFAVLRNEVQCCALYVGMLKKFNRDFVVLTYSKKLITK